jgi:DNA-directed RNA polymerase subunit RPC12/RpoP
MEIEFRCPHCRAVGQAVDWQPEAAIRCPHCGHGLGMAPGAEDPPAPARPAEAAPAEAAPAEFRLERCPVCGGHEFYRQRDFNRRLGLALVLLGAALAWPTRGLSLLVVVIADLLLYALLPPITICYRCEAIFRGLPAGAGGGDFDLATADKYRAIRAEEEAARGGEHGPATPP